jgi:phage terminase Nu1 subunit (DNA packaging protein)
MSRALWPAAPADNERTDIIRILVGRSVKCNITAYGDHAESELGINPSRIAHYVKRGMPVAEGGLDREVCLEWIARNVIPQGGQNADKGASRVNAIRRSNGPMLCEAPRAREPDHLDPPQERARRDRAATRKLELENGVREGQLISTEEVARTWQRVVGLVRSSLLNMPSKLAARLAGKPAAEILGILALEVSDILEALAASPIRRNPPLKHNGNGAEDRP